MIAKPTPDRAVVVDGDWVRNDSLLCSLSNVVDVFLEREFGGVHANDDQPLLTVPGGPRANVRQCAKPVDAGVRPKVDRTTLPCMSSAVSGGELSQAVAPPSEAKSLALDGLNGFTVIICITESLVPIHAAPSDSAAIPKKRRRSGRGRANIHLCLCMKGTACGHAVPSSSAVFADYLRSDRKPWRIARALPLISSNTCGP